MQLYAETKPLLQGGGAELLLLARDPVACTIFLEN